MQTVWCKKYADYVKKYMKKFFYDAVIAKEMVVLLQRTIVYNLKLLCKYYDFTCSGDGDI